jgi:hypothetical protein
MGIRKKAYYHNGECCKFELMCLPYWVCFYIPWNFSPFQILLNKTVKGVKKKSTHMPAV